MGIKTDTNPRTPIKRELGPSKFYGLRRSKNGKFCGRNRSTYFGPRHRSDTWVTSDPYRPQWNQSTLNSSVLLVFRLESTPSQYLVTFEHLKSRDGLCRDSGIWGQGVGISYSRDFETPRSQPLSNSTINLKKFVRIKSFTLLYPRTGTRQSPRNSTPMIHLSPEFPYY